MNAISKNSFTELKNGVVLAELGGYGDGPYCAQHGAGAALVLMGTYIVDSHDKVPYPAKFVFKPDPSVYAPYLRKHVQAARAGGAKVGVSVISIELQHTLDFLVAAQEAGADYASLCAHSVMAMFVRNGLGEALCERGNSKSLRRWAKAILNAATIPVIFKIGLGDLPATIAAVDTLTEVGVPIVSINLGKTTAGSAGLKALKQIAGHCLFLIAGGGIKDLEGARRVLEQGADAVAIGTAAMKKPALCGDIQKHLK
ncbi:MAG: HisA/HisF-related TIM barrel protein [Kiritimatiellaeota bacterium]|nr:HisA/HisF-related TIM barrel protein [Kiritimatiellota bacterium]